MTKIAKIAFIAVAALLASCSRDKITTTPEAQSNGAIAFESGELTTRGDVLDSDGFDMMDIYAYYTETTAFASASTFTSFMHQQAVSRSEDETTSEWSDWSYSPIKYWPTASGSKISFFAFAPYMAATKSSDNDGRPVFTYHHTAYAGETADLNYAANLDETQSSDAVSFNLSRLMSRISLSAMITGEEVLDGVSKEATIWYNVYGITFFGVYNKMNYAYSSDDGGYTWTLDTSSSSIDYTATQGVTLKNADGNNQLTTTDYIDICEDGQAIFVLPQSVEDVTMQLRIMRTVEESGEQTTTILSSSNDISVPTLNNSGEWGAGEWTNLKFTLDLSSIDEDFAMPMTVEATVYDWTETEVEANINSNLYIYASNNDLSVQTYTDEDYTEISYGEFMICTNYDYNLRVPHHRQELDGSITSSRGFLFCSNDFNDDPDTPDDEGADTYHVDTYTGSDGTTFKVFVPTLLTTTGREIYYLTEDDYEDESITFNNIGEFSEEDITWGSNGYGYVLDTSTGFYNLLCYTDTDESGVEFTGANTYNIYEFLYEDEDEDGFHEINLDYFADSNNTVSFKIKIRDGYEFDFSVRRSTRTDEELYVSTVLDSDTNSSYGVNKEGDDAVYILRISVNSDHLAAANGKFDDTIGVEMISNGGGMIAQLFPVTLTQ